MASSVGECIATFILKICCSKHDFNDSPPNSPNLQKSSSSGSEINIDEIQKAITPKIIEELVPEIASRIASKKVLEPTITPINIMITLNEKEHSSFGAPPLTKTNNPIFSTISPPIPTPKIEIIDSIPSPPDTPADV
jgi:hypothetical protein